MKINKYHNICNKYYTVIKEKCLPNTASNVASESNLTTANIFVPFNTHATSDLPETNKRYKTECELLHILYTNCLLFQENKNKNKNDEKNKDSNWENT